MGEAPPQTGKKRILIAPACFKGSISAIAVAELIHAFLQKHFRETVMLDICPIADGGDDTLACLRYHDPHFEHHQSVVTGPLPAMLVKAEFLLHSSRKIAVIEAAQAHGLKHLTATQQSEQNPMAATSYGVGELIKAALQQAQQQHTPLDSLIVSVGGSASTDGGTGALQALGVRFLNVADQPFLSPIGGGDLSTIHHIEWALDWPHPGKVLIATDVVNPLLGEHGAAQIFGPQKGASPTQCKTLETGLQHFRTLLNHTTLIPTDLSKLPGTGAAGGLAYGLRHLPRAHIISGSQWIADTIALEKRIAEADFIITGEGRLDATSLSGKATGQILQWAKGKPVLVLCGQADKKLDVPSNITVKPLADTNAQIAYATNHPEEALLEKLHQLWPTLQQQLGIAPLP